MFSGMGSMNIKSDLLKDEVKTFFGGPQICLAPSHSLNPGVK
jgi:hypothetical protein